MSKYSIQRVQQADKPHEYVVTIARDGKAVGSVRVLSCNSQAAYFNWNKTCL